MRWAALLDSDQRDGKELRAAWAALHQEARECEEYQQEEVECVVANWWVRTAAGRGQGTRQGTSS